MKPKQFKQKFWPEIEAACAETGLNPLFVAAQAALESGWGEKAIGNNLFGIAAGTGWKGMKQLRTTFEYFADDRQGGKFPKVYSITRLPDGRYKYVVDRYFRDYPTLKECLDDHFQVFSQKDFLPAMKFKADPGKFAFEIAKCGYCTADPDVYAATICGIVNMLQKV